MTVFVILTDLLITVAVYLSFPFFYRKKHGRVPLKKARKIALINCIVCAVAFELFQAIVSQNDPTYIPSFAPAFFYYFISVNMLKENLPPFLK